MTPSIPAVSEAERIALLDKVEQVLSRRFPICRDCADNDGICENSGLPCDLRAAFDDLRAALSAASLVRSQQDQPDWPPQVTAIGLADGEQRHGSTGQLWE